MIALDQRKRTATSRKRRTCFACGLRFRPGDVYLTTSFADDGRVYALDEHEQCSLALANPREFDGDGLPERYLVEYVFDEDVTPEWRAWYAERRATEQPRDDEVRDGLL